MKKNLTTSKFYFSHKIISAHRKVLIKCVLLQVQVLLLLFSLFSTANADSYTWLGGNGNWEDKTNWGPQGVPGSNDAVFISSGTCETSGATVEKLYIDGAKLIIAGDLNITEILTMTGHSSVIGGQGNINIDSVMYWHGGDLRGPGQINIIENAELFISGEDQKDLYRTINNRGLTFWSSDDFAFGTLYGDGSINNYGWFDIESDGTLKNGAVPLLTINNYGTIKKGANMLSATIQPMVNNFSEIIISGGTLALNGGGFNIGTYSIINADDTLKFTNGIHSMNGNEFTGDGVIHIDLGINGRFAVDSAASSFAFGTTMFFEKGVIQGTSDMFNIHGDIIWAGGTFRALDTIMLHPTSHMEILGDASKTWSTFMINKGVIDWKDGDVTYSTLYAPPALGLLNENVMNLEAANTFANGTSGNGFINNVGLLRRRNNTGLAKIRSQVNNYGVTEIITGTLDLYGGGYLSNFIQIDSLASLGLRQNTFHTNNAFITGKGTLNVQLTSTSSLSIDSLKTSVDTATTITLNSGLIAGDGQLHIFGQFEWNKGELRCIDTVFLHNTAKTKLTSTGEKKYRTRIVNKGNLTWDGGLVRFQNNNGEPCFENNGTFHIQSDEIFGEGNLGVGLFVNNGIVSKSITEDITTFKCFVKNNNQFNVKSGQVALRGGSDFSFSQLNLGKNAILRFQTKDHTLDSTFISGAGSALLYSTGTWDDIFIKGQGIVVDTAAILEVMGFYTEISGDGPIHLHGRMNWGGGILRTSDTLHIHENALINIHSDPDKDLRTDIINQGKIDWIGGNVKVAGSPTLLNYGLFNVFSHGNYGLGGSGEIINYNKVRKVFASSSSILNSFNNRGSLEIEMGSLRFAKNLVNDTLGVISGIDTLDVVSANFENYGDLEPGLSTGALRIIGDLPSSPSSDWRFELAGYEAGAEYDVINIEGEAELSGNLEISLLNGLQPAANDSFRVMTYESYIGEFDNLLVPSMYNAHIHYGSTFLTVVFAEINTQEPMALNDHIYILEDQTDTLNVLLNDINADNLSLELISVDAPAKIYGDSSIIYIPKPNFYGTDSLQYTFEIEGGEQYSAMIYIFIESVNDAPNAFTVNQPSSGDSLDIMTEQIEFLWSASSDVDNDPITYSFHLWNNELDTTITGLTATNYLFNLDNTLALETTYHWNIVASDGFTTTYSDTSNFYTISTKVLGFGDELTKNLKLEGNYPNPFYSSTTIAFNLLEDAQVSIEILSANGSFIETVLNDFLPEGGHAIEIQGSKISEGLLIYRIISKNDHTSMLTGKMLHIR